MENDEGGVWNETYTFETGFCVCEPSIDGYGFKCQYYLYAVCSSAKVAGQCKETETILIINFRYIMCLQYMSVKIIFSIIST